MLLLFYSHIYYYRIAFKKYICYTLKYIPMTAPFSILRAKLTPPSNRSLRIPFDRETYPTGRQDQDESGLSAVSDLSQRMAIVAATRRGRNAVR